MLLVTAMNLLPLLLLVLLPRLVLFFGFLWPLCGFSLIALYDLKVIEKSSPFWKAALRSRRVRIDGAPLIIY